MSIQQAGWLLASPAGRNPATRTHLPLDMLLHGIAPNEIDSLRLVPGQAARSRYPVVLSLMAASGRSRATGVNSEQGVLQKDSKLSCLCCSRRGCSAGSMPADDTQSRVRTDRGLWDKPMERSQTPSFARLKRLCVVAIPS
jgi:hypothetical protein